MVSKKSVVIKRDILLQKLKKGQGYLLILLLSVFLTSLVLFKNFLFGEKLLIYRDIGSDTFYSYYRFYYLLVDQIHNWDFSFWSFKMGVGTSVLTLYAFLYDPFSIIYFLVGADNISTTFIYIFVLKVLLSAYFAYLFFSYIKVGIIPTIICSLIFAFNGYLMLWGQHYFFSSGVVFLPLLLFALERFLREEKWLLLLSVLAILSLNMYFFYQIFIFVIVYYLFRMIFDEAYNIRKFILMTLKFMVIFSLAIGLVATLILPEYHLLQASPRTSAGSITSIFHMKFLFNSFEYYFSIFSRLFSNNLQGVGSSYLGFHNYYESMQLYCGLLFILLFPQAFSLFEIKQKKLVLAGLFLTVIFIIFPFFARIMNGFQYATYRWGYNIIFAELLLLAFVMKVIIEKGKVNYKLLCITSLTIIGCLFLINSRYVNEVEIHQYNVSKIWQSIGFIIIYLLSVFLLTKQGVIKNLALAILLIAVSVEMVTEHRDTFEKRSTLTKGMESDKTAIKNNYEIDLFGYTNDVISYLESMDDSFFRIEKNRWISSMNDSVVQGYKGLDSYNSLNTPSYFEFIDQLDIPPVPNAPSNLRMNILGWTSLQRPYLADLLSVRYYLTKDPEVITGQSKHLKTIGDIHVYERLTARPFGFVYDQYIDREKFFSIVNKNNQRDRLLLSGFLPPDQSEKPLVLDKFSQISYENQEYEINDEDNYGAFVINSYADDEIIGTISLAREGMLFISIPHDPGWQATVDNQPVEIHKINIGFSGLLLKEGDHQIEFKYQPPYLKAGIIISLISLFIVMILLYFSKQKSRFVNQSQD